MSNIEEAIKYKNLGNECFSAQKYEEAIQHFSKAIDLNPNDHVFFSNRSACYASLEQYEQALEDATRCVTLKPEWSKGYTRKGLAEFYLEKYEDAEKTYETGLQLDPSNQQLKEGLDRVKEAKTEGGADASGNFMQQAFGKLLTNPETAAFFQDPEFVKKLTAIQKNPQMISLYMNDPKISKAFQVILGGFGGAGDMFGGEGAPGAGGMGGFPGAGAGAGAGAAHGDDHHDHSNCGPHGHSHEKPAATEEAKYESEPFFKPKETKPEPPKAKAPLTPAEEEKTKGNDEYKKKNFDKAIGHYLKATELDPSEPIYYNNLAAVYLEKKEYDKAIECCDKAEEICKSGTYDYIKFAKVLARKASAYVHKGDLEKGLDLYSKSLLENNDAKVKEDMKKVEKLIKDQESKAYVNPELAEQHRAKGNELYGQGKFPDAIKEYDEAIRRNPTDAKLYANRATGLMKLMEYPTALKDIDRCIELDPVYVKAYAKKGVIHHFLKEYHKAIESYEKGLQLDPNNEECKSGVAKTRMQIMGASGESKEDQAARFKRAMEDPEIRAILQDPQIMQILRDLQERPQDPNNTAALRDPTISKKIDKLIAAGVLRMG